MAEKHYSTAYSLKIKITENTVTQKMGFCTYLTLMKCKLELIVCNALINIRSEDKYTNKEEIKCKILG